MERRSCINCLHVQVCGLQKAVLTALSDYAHVLKDLFAESGENLAAALAKECNQFSPAPLDWKGGAS